MSFVEWPFFGIPNAKFPIVECYLAVVFADLPIWYFNDGYFARIEVGFHIFTLIRDKNIIGLILGFLGTHRSN